MVELLFANRLKSVQQVLRSIVFSANDSYQDFGEDCSSIFFRQSERLTRLLKQLSPLPESSFV